MTAAKKQEEVIFELERAVAYYRKRIDELSGENIKGEYRISGLRKEIKQKRSAFALISKLQLAFGDTTSVDDIFKMTLDAISQTLDVDRAIILVPTDETNCYSPSVWQGQERLVEEQVAGFKELSFEFPGEFSTDPGQYLIFTRDTAPTPLSEQISNGLDLPFFACTPIIVEQRSLGVLMVGRLKEAGTAYPPLDKGDVETLFAICGLMSSIIQNMRVGVLQEMDRLKTEFFANLSHEFRTPITLTIGAIDGMISGRFGSIDSKLLEQADLVKRNQSRLLNLITQILDLEKMESGNEMLKAIRLKDLNGFLKKRLDQFEFLTSKKNVNLKYTKAAGLDTAAIFIDPEKFDRMLFNLLSNAVKFTEQGQIHLEATLDESSYGFRVTDTGVGIKASQLPHIFDRFRQANGSSSREYAGTGIGLSLVKQVADLHGGKVFVQSKYGKGTTFEVKLPLGTAHLQPNEILEGLYSETDSDEQSTLGFNHVFEMNEGRATAEQIKEIDDWNELVAKSRSKRMGTVLYVDDNKDLRFYVSDLLKIEFNVFIAYDGVDGLAKAHLYAPDIIVSDLMMPNMTGEEFLQSVRSSQELQGIPFVLLTAKSGVESKLSNLAKGADDYLNKPFSEVELKARVKNLIKIRKQQQRIQSDLIAARGIQQALLPDLDTMQIRGESPPKFEAMYRPCDLLSGDFYDVIEKDNHVIFYIADVTSHGTASAQVTYIIKSLMVEIINAIETSISATEILKSLYLKYLHLNLTYAVALQLGVYCKKTGDVEVIGAGSPPALLKSGDKTSECSPSSGSFLHPDLIRSKGIEEIAFEARHIQLNPDDILYFYTDGCFEFVDRKTQTTWTPRKLARLFNRTPKNDWQNFVLQELQQAVGELGFDDDLTILRISR